MQIAAEIPPDRIIVLNLEEFQSLVSASYTKLYPIFARYAAPRNITVERLIEISHLVVRDPTHILSREPPAPQLPVLSSLLASAHPLPQPAEVYKTLQLIASKFAKASASKKPPLVDTFAAGSRAPWTVAPNAPGSQLPPISESPDSDAHMLHSAYAATNGAARLQTLAFLRARAPELSASYTDGSQGPSADASAASALVSMPSDANLQETGGDDESLAPDTNSDFEQSANSDVLDRGLSDIRTLVMPHAERHAQFEAPHKQSAESAAKHQHHHPKTKRPRRKFSYQDKGSRCLSNQVHRGNNPGFSMVYFFSRAGIVK